MGAAIMKSCLAGEPAGEPAGELAGHGQMHYHEQNHREARRRYEQHSRRLAKTLPPANASADADARSHREKEARRRLQAQYVAAGRRTLDLPHTAVRLQHLPRPSGSGSGSSSSSIAIAATKPKQTQRATPVGTPSSVSSEAATTSESSFADESPRRVGVGVSASPRAYSPAAAGFRALLPAEYKLECVAGKGTTSICYKCVRVTDGQRFACKIIEKRRLAASARKRLEVAAQLRREVDVLRRVDHPHIAKLEEAFENDAFLILVMELLEGGELFDAIVDKGRFSEREAAHVARALLSAIAHMHERGVVHRDLKPENMLLAVGRANRHGRKAASDALDVKIIDFGFAKVLATGATSTSFLGTGGYLAPEILLRQPYASAVDMWSFGVLAYLLLCGRLPFAATTQLRPTQKVATLYKLSFPKKYWQGVSPMARDFLQRLLVLDPSQRLTAKDALNHPWLRH